MLMRLTRSAFEVHLAVREPKGQFLSPGWHQAATRRKRSCGPEQVCGEVSKPAVRSISRPSVRRKAWQHRAGIRDPVAQRVCLALAGRCWVCPVWRAWRPSTRYVLCFAARLAACLSHCIKVSPPRMCLAAHPDGISQLLLWPRSLAPIADSVDGPDHGKILCRSRKGKGRL
jgi:hypothetical protein